MQPFGIVLMCVAEYLGAVFSPKNTFFVDLKHFCRHDPFAICRIWRAQCVSSHYPAGCLPQVVKFVTKFCIKQCSAPLGESVRNLNFRTCCYAGTLDARGYLRIGECSGHLLVSDKGGACTSFFGFSLQSLAVSGFWVVMCLVVVLSGICVSAVQNKNARLA